MLFGIIIKSSICNCLPSGSIFIWLSGFEVPIKFLTWSSNGNFSVTGLFLLSGTELGVSVLVGSVVGSVTLLGSLLGSSLISSDFGRLSGSEVSDSFRSSLASMLDSGD